MENRECVHVGDADEVECAEVWRKPNGEHFLVSYQSGSGAERRMADYRFGRMCERHNLPPPGNRSD